MIKKIGIECHNLEGHRFGVGQTLIQLLEEISQTPGVAEKFEFYLYFKKEIPPDKILESPIFRKKIIHVPFLPPSFTIFYHILIPLYYFIDSLNGFFFPGYMLPAFFIGKSAVVLTNDVRYEIYSGNLPWRYRIAYWLFSWWAAKKTDKIITLSETAKREISNWYKIPKEKIAVIPWGLSKDLAAISFSRKEDDRIKQKFSIQDDFIFSWGQAFPRRHIKEAILAFEKIAPDLPNLQYLVACADKYNPPILEKLVEKINANLKREAIIHRKYINDRRELFCLIKQAKLTLYISSSEAMGLPPLEALALGTPSVIADNDLSREIFGDSAFFVKHPSEPEKIAQKIKEGISDNSQRRKIIENRLNITEKFSWTGNLNLLIKLFDKIFQ